MCVKEKYLIDDLELSVGRLAKNFLIFSVSDELRSVQKGSDQLLAEGLSESSCGR